MIIFINDIPVRILKAGNEPERGRINHVVDAATEPVTQSKMIHHVWVTNAVEKDLDALLALLDSKVPTNILSLDITAKDYEAAKTYLLSKFKVIKAAGGLVRKKEKFLMIYRMKKWDLPKGKKEKGETYKEAAVREVGEECNITVKRGGRICTTWHTYTMNKNAMIKKTKWYIMDVIDDTRLKPATEEDIEEARWMSQKEVYHALEHSYKSIRHVVEQYYAARELKSTK
jgi:ADP-ribose pyrophosphatase YjhB (NUDIX family)